jgi:hypothetical protein
MFVRWRLVAAVAQQQYTNNAGYVNEDGNVNNNNVNNTYPGVRPASPIAR